MISDWGLRKIGTMVLISEQTKLFSKSMLLVPHFLYLKNRGSNLENAELTKKSLSQFLCFRDQFLSSAFIVLHKSLFLLGKCGTSIKGQFTKVPQFRIICRPCLRLCFQPRNFDNRIVSPPVVYPAS